MNVKIIRELAKITYLIHNLHKIYLSEDIKKQGNKLECILIII